MPGSATTALAAATGLVSAMAWAVRGRSSSVFAPSVWRGRPGRKAIALTFDDGPSPATPALLRLLAEYNAKTFMADTGATLVVLTYEDAERLGLSPRSLEFSGIAQTANGGLEPRALAITVRFDQASFVRPAI